MRPLMMDFGNDKNVLNISNQYMFGNDLMICPVYQYKARKREVYFPEGAGWYNLYDGKFIAGGQKQTVEAPYERMPIYVAAGSVLPIGKIVQNTSQAQNDLTIFIYAGKNGTFSLYEDENLNYNYEKGKYSTIDFNYNDKSKTLSISDRNGSFNGMTKVRNFRIVLVNQKDSHGIDQTEKTSKLVHYVGKKIGIKL